MQSRRALEISRPAVCNTPGDDLNLRSAMMNGSTMRMACAVLMMLVLGGCKSAFYGTWEKLGWAKRDILVDRVKDAKEEQEGAKKQFQSALEQFQALTGFQGGELEAKYKKLNKEYEGCESRAKAVSKEIASVDSVAKDLFSEWNKELAEYDNAELRRSSEQKLRDTRQRYDQMYAAMKNAEGKMEPVLKAFRTQVLYLKHNLNAQAIASLQTQVGGIQSDVDRLVRDMETAIQEASTFINQMK
jgi:chromosome segregation ATPase